VASKSLVNMAEGIVGELGSECVMCRVLLFLVVLPCVCASPAAGEFVFLL
jgi:hypothetical protein